LIGDRTGTTERVSFFRKNLGQNYNTRKRGGARVQRLPFDHGARNQKKTQGVTNSLRDREGGSSRESALQGSEVEGDQIQKKETHGGKADVRELAERTQRRDTTWSGKTLKPGGGGGAKRGLTQKMRPRRLAHFAVWSVC